jgi:mRNA-degrading endonuclease toxin of MazEF toxin-antitoxin module
MPCPDMPKKPTPSLHCEKGDIHWFLLENPNPNVNSLKVRPFIIISRTNYKSKRVLVSPIQDLKNYVEEGRIKYPFHVPLLKSDYTFLDKDSIILLDQVYTIEKSELWQEWYIGKLKDFTALDNAIIYNFDLYESIKNGISELLDQYKDLYMQNFKRK